MYSLGGRWVKMGQKTPEGHMVDGYDPRTGFLNISYAGVPLVPLKMRESVIQDYNPQFAQGQPLGEKNLGVDSRPFQGFSENQMQMIRTNSAKNPRVRKDINGIVSLAEYQKLIKDKKAKKGHYLIPKYLDDGEVDLEDFWYEPDEGQQEEDDLDYYFGK
jgi:hypothetical protein